MKNFSDYEYTLKMDTVFSDNTADLNRFFCREDLLDALRIAKTVSRDGRIFRTNDLEDICEGCGIDMNELFRNPSLADILPTRSQLQGKILENFYGIYKNSPSTGNYMERLVRRLAPEYKDDSVRLAILKKIVVGSDESFKTLKISSLYRWTEQQLSPTEAELYRKADADIRRGIVLSKLNESIFLTPLPKASPHDLLCFMAGCVQRFIDEATMEFDDILLTSDTQDLVDGFMADCGLSGEYSDCCGKLAAIANCAQAVQNFPQPLAQAIEKDLKAQLKGTRHLTAQSRKIESGNDWYLQMKDDFEDRYKSDLHIILNLCNDLAKGNFRNNGVTRKNLYLFAFIFNMTVPLEGKITDPDRDIVKNLFHDYYNDNLKRFLEGDYTDASLAANMEKEPTGEGINYKNFAEAVYIYFLCRDKFEYKNNTETLTPAEKIDEAERIISACVKLAGKNKAVRRRPDGHTEYYRTHLTTLLLNKKVDEIPGHIAENYLIKDPYNSKPSRLMAASEQASAADLVAMIMDEIEQEQSDGDTYAYHYISQEDAALYKDSLHHSSLPSFDWKLGDMLNAVYGNDLKFMQVVDNLDLRAHSRVGPFSVMEKKRLLLLLHFLVCESDSESPISMDRIRSRMDRDSVTLGHKVVSMEFDLYEGLKTLSEGLKFDIKKIKVPVKTRTQGDDKSKYVYYLDRRSYDDEAMNRLIRLVSHQYTALGSEATEIITNLLKRGLRVKRTELIALKFISYISVLNNSPRYFMSFKEVYEDFCYQVNMDLAEARYQELSTKNLFDMYIVSELYFHLTENIEYKH